MKIKIIKMVACPPWNLSALPGDVIEIEDKQGQELINLERAVLAENIETKPEKTPAKKSK